MLNHGDVCAILVLGYFSAKDFDMSRLSIYFTIKFLPPNVTNMHRPVDKGMVASLKAGYKPLYLQRLLAIFDEPG